MVVRKSKFALAVARNKKRFSNSVPFFGGLLELVKKWEVLPEYLCELQREFKYKTIAVPAPYIGSIPGGSVRNLTYLVENNTYVTSHRSLFGMKRIWNTYLQRIL